MEGGAAIEAIYAGEDLGTDDEYVVEAVLLAEELLDLGGGAIGRSIFDWLVATVVFLIAD